MKLDLTEQDLLMYIQEGMVNRVFVASGLPRRPTYDFIQANPLVYQLTSARAHEKYAENAELVERFTRPVESVLDIGCGLGLSSLYMYHALDPKPSLFLVDGVCEKSYDEIGEYMAAFNPDADEFVSDIRVTYEFLRRNGVDPSHINLIGPDLRCVSHLRDIDMVISNGSWFYHYPKEVYWDGIKEAMHQHSMLRVDIRVKRVADSDITDNSAYIDFLREQFREVEILRHYHTRGTPLRAEVFARDPKWI